MVKCPVCSREEGFSPVEEVREFKILKCSSCSLEFSDPMNYDAQLYDRLYKENDLGLPYSEYARITSFLRVHPKKAQRFLELSQLYTLRWIKKHFKPGAKVLDVGCGSGSFLFALKQQGYEPYGIEVADIAVRELKSAGFSIAEGSLESTPKEWGSFDIVTLFEVLEHLPDPLEFLDSIKRKWPDALLILSVPDPKRVWLLFHKRETGDYPPHHFTRWTPKALKTALLKVGYEQIRIKRLRPRGSQIITRTGIVAFLRKIMSGTQQPSVERPVYNAPLPIIAKDILFWPVAMGTWLFGWHNTQMVFTAR